MHDFLHNDPEFKELFALLLPDIEIRKSFIQRYSESAHLYYKGQPDFEIILALIKENIYKF